MFGDFPRSKKINMGIFIDAECTEISTLGNGVYLSTAVRSNSLIGKQHQQELEEFLGKWYPELNWKGYLFKDSSSDALDRAPLE